MNLDGRRPERIQTYPQHCSNCHKSLENLCRDCNDEKESDRSRESYRTAENSTSQPFSFNIPQKSVFNVDEDAQRKTYNQMMNYQKLYGDLRLRKFHKNVETAPDPLNEILTKAQNAVITGYARNLLKNADESHVAAP